MAAKTTTYANNLLLLIFNATDYAGIATHTGATNLYVSLHTATLNASSSQNTSEAAYTGYARVAVTRTSGGWTVTNNTVNPAGTITFGSCSSSTANETETYFGIGTTSAGAGQLLYWGTVTPSIVVSAGVTPELTTGSAITEV